MGAILLVAWSLFCIAAAAGLTYFIMRSRMEVRLAQQREELAAVQATLTARKDALGDSLKSAGDSIRRQALDEFLERCVQARADLPSDTLVLTVDEQTPAELAESVLTAIGE